MSSPRPNRNLDSYVGVHTRIEQFRAEHKAGKILTQIIEGEKLIVRAEVYFEGNDSTMPNGVGHASEDGGMGNRARSALEMTETAAVGRALAMCGYEVKEGIASREEVERAETRSQSRPASNLKAVPEKNAAPQLTAAQLDVEILAALDALGKQPNDPWLDEQVKRKYPDHKAPWHKSSVERKGELLRGLKAKIDQKAAKE